MYLFSDMFNLTICIFFTMICVGKYCRIFFASTLLWKIHHGCQTEIVPGGRITVSAGFYYLLAVNVLELTLEHLHIEFDKLHSRNKKSCLGTMLAFFCC
jgi:hypothetical protein